MGDFAQELLAAQAGVPKPEEEGPGFLKRYVLSPVENVLGFQKRGIDYLANLGADIAIGPGAHEMSAGQMLGEAAFGSPEQGEGYLSALGRAGLQTASDVALDPLTWETIGLAGAASPAKAASMAASGDIAPELVNAALASAGKARKIQKFVDPVFAATLAAGTAEVLPPTIKAFQEQGLTPQTAALGLQTGLQAGFTGLAGAHAFRGAGAPVGPKEMLAEGLRGLIEKGEMDKVTADQVLLRHQFPEQMKAAQAEAEAAQAAAASPPEATAPPAQAVAPEAPPEAPPPAINVPEVPPVTGGAMPEQAQPNATVAQAPPPPVPTAAPTPAPLAGTRFVAQKDGTIVDMVNGTRFIVQPDGTVVDAAVVPPTVSPTGLPLTTPPTPQQQMYQDLIGTMPPRPFPNLPPRAETELPPGPEQGYTRGAPVNLPPRERLTYPQQNRLAAAQDLRPDQVAAIRDAMFGRQPEQGPAAPVAAPPAVTELQNIVDPIAARLAAATDLRPDQIAAVRAALFGSSPEQGPPAPEPPPPPPAPPTPPAPTGPPAAGLGRAGDLRPDQIAAIRDALFGTRPEQGPEAPPPPPPRPTPVPPREEAVISPEVDRQLAEEYTTKADETNIANGAKLGAIEEDVATKINGKAERRLNPRNSPTEAYATEFYNVVRQGITDDLSNGEIRANLVDKLTEINNRVKSEGGSTADVGNALETVANAFKDRFEAAEQARELTTEEARARITDLPDSTAKDTLIRNPKSIHIFEVIYNSIARGEGFPKVADFLDAVRKKGQGMAPALAIQIKKALVETGLLPEAPKQGKRLEVREAQAKEKAARQAAEEEATKPTPEKFQDALDAEKARLGRDLTPEELHALTKKILNEPQTPRGIVRQQAEKEVSPEVPRPTTTAEIAPRETEPTEIDPITRRLYELSQIGRGPEVRAIEDYYADPANMNELVQLLDGLELRVKGFDQSKYEVKGDRLLSQRKQAQALLRTVRRTGFDPTLRETTHTEARIAENAANALPEGARRGPDQNMGVKKPGGSIWDETVAKSKAELSKPSGDAELFGANRLYHMAVVGADYMKRGLTNTVEFGRQLIREFGEAVKPYIRQIYNKASEILRSFSVGPLAEEPGGTVIGSLGGAFQKSGGGKRVKLTPQELEAMAEATRSTRQVDEGGKPFPRKKGEYEANINIGKSSTLEGERQLAAREAEAIPRILGKGPGGEREPMTFKQIHAEAQKNLMGQEEIASVARKQKRMLTASQMENVKDLSRKAEADFAEAVKVADEAKAKNDPDTDLYELNRDQLAQGVAAMQAIDVGAANEVGRALGYRRALVEAMDENAYVIANIRRTWGKLNPDVTKLLREAILKNKPELIKEALRQQNDPTKFKQFLEWWKSWGLLSGPPTHLANWFGNTLARELKYFDTAASAMVDNLKAKLTGSQRERFIGEWRAMQVGNRQLGSAAFKRLMSDLWNAARAKEGNVRDLFETSKIEFPGAVAGKTGEIARIWFKFLDAADNYWKTKSGIEELYKQLYRKARKGGLDHEAATTRMVEGAEKYLREEAGITARIIKGHSEEFVPISKMVEEARRYYTFQKGSNLASLTNRLLQQVPALQIVFPFVRTPIDIAKMTGEHTAVGTLHYLAKWHRETKALKANPKFERTMDTGQLTDQIAKGVVGTTIAAAVYGLAANGIVTGGGPSDPKLQSAKKETGWQPYSIRFPGVDSYMPYNRFEPVSSIVGLAADMNEALQSGDVKTAGDFYEKLLGSIGENLLSKTFLSGLEGLSTAIHDPRRYMAQWIKSTESTLVPNIVGKVAQAVDPVYRKTTLGVSPLLAKIPFASESLEPQTTATGEPRTRKGTPIERFLSPVPMTKEKGPEAELYREFVKIGFSPSAGRDYLSPMGRKTPLLPEEKVMFAKARQAATEVAIRVIKDPSYQRLPDNEEEAPPGTRKTKQDVLSAIFRRYNKMVQDRIMPSVTRRMLEQYKAQNAR